jgi:hypothetical protein
MKWMNLLYESDSEDGNSENDYEDNYGNTGNYTSSDDDDDGDMRLLQEEERQLQALERNEY